MKSSRWHKFLNHFFGLLLFAFIFINALSAFAGPGKTTYQAKIVKPDGYPLEVSSVNFKFTILDPAGSCILYSETYSSVNMSGTGGLISFALGSGVKVYPASATTFEQVFSNITPSLSCDTGGPVSYSPAASDIRKIVMQFHDGSGWQTLPAMSINAVPYAMYANEATKLNGLTSSDFVQVSTVPTCTASEALRYTGAGFTCVAVGNSVTSGTVVTALGYTPADSVSLTTVTSNVSSVSSTVFSVSSTVTSLQNSVAASFAAITSSQWTTSGTTIFYNTGNIGIGTTTPVTKLDVSGGVRIGAESTTCAPALAGTLRYNATNVEYCNGTSWQAFGVSGAGITNFNGSTSGTQSFATGTGGTAPNFATANGVHTLNLPLANTGSVIAGLISNADYTTFTNKITSSAASIAQVLGYIPADNAASGTYAQKANNLSDLTNVATARTNLGLGTFATASSIDLGSTSATGTLAIARLPNFTGDATIAAASNTIVLSNSGVTAGTYTKVTVDNKGRVTSGAQIISSDVTTALGYTPASASASTQWTTSGANIYYNTGNVGVGTANPTAKLVVSGSALIGTASMNYSGSASAAILTAGSPIIFDGGSSSIARLIWSGGTLSFGKCQDTTCGPMSPYLDINTTSNITTFYNMNSVRAGNGYGTATAPTFSFGGNTDIGMFNPGSGILSFSTSGAERVRLTSVGTIGIGTTTPVTKLDVSGGVRISMESATCAANFAGTLRYNAGNVEYCNGTSWSAFGVATSGITSLNGAASQTQSFANGTVGTAPAFNTANGVHTLNLPLANTGSVTAGLISNTDYTTFTNKITSSAASIAQVLSYIPADNAVSGTYAQKANNLSDLTNIATARTNLGLGTFATASSIDLGSASATGTLAIARLPSFTGDATITAASNTIILSNSGVTAGTYTKVTVDSKGRVTSSAALASSDVTTALGYTPANSATIVSSQWITSGTNIFYNTGNVGVGTTSPDKQLTMHSTGLDNYIHLTSSLTGTTALDGVMIGTGSAGDAAFYNRESTNMLFLTSNTERVRIDASGNVGIGITAPESKLHVGAGAILLDNNYALKGKADNGTAYDLISVATDGSTRLRGFHGTDLIQGVNGATYLYSSGGGGTTMTLLGGNVGVGTTNPTSKLSMNVSAAYDGIRIDSTSNGFLHSYVNAGAGSNNGITQAGDKAIIYGGSTIDNAGGLVIAPWKANTSGIRLDASGNVGIGTSNPGSRLHIATPVSGGVNNRLVSGNSNGDLIDVTGVSGDSFLDHIVSARYTATASTTLTKAVTFKIDGAPTVSGTDLTVTEKLAFWVEAGASSFGGNVGIGTTNPMSAKLHLQSSPYGGTPADANNRLKIESSGHSYIGLYSPNTFDQGIHFGDPEGEQVGRITYRHSTDMMQFRTNAVERMVIDSSGNVGIGTVAPAAKLEVAGDIVGQAQVFRAYLSAPFSKSVSWEKIPFNVTYFNTLQGTFDTINNRFTASRSGYYQVGVSGYSSASSASGDRYGFALLKNGVQETITGGNYSAVDTPFAPLSTIVYMNGTTDYIEIHMYSAIAATLSSGATGYGMQWNMSYLGK